MPETFLVLEGYSNEEQKDTLRELFVLRPKCIDHFIEDITYFKNQSIDYIESIPNLFRFIELFTPLVKRANEAHTQSEVLSVTTELRDLENRLEQLQLGPFTTSAWLEVDDCLNNMRHALIALDMQRYKEHFNSHISTNVFNFFTTGEKVQGLPQSLQGTLVASEVLSRETNIHRLNRELNLVYPGAGGHLTPLLMAFDLIERNSIDTANLMLNDMHNDNTFIHASLRKFEEAEIITNLEVGNADEDGARTKYLFMYKNHSVCVEFVHSDFRDVADWTINGRNPNVVYDHIPFKSAPPGSATRFFSTQNSNRLQGSVFYIIPTSTADVNYLAAGNTVVSVERVNNVSFADKHSWTVAGQEGVGLTVALIDYH